MSTKYCHCISLASSYQKIHRVRKTWRLYSEQLKEMGGGVYENQEADQGRARRSRARRSRGYVGSEKYVSTACKVRKSCSDTPIQRSPENSMKEWVLTKRLFSGAKWHWGEQNIKERRKMKNSWCSPFKFNYWTHLQLWGCRYDPTRAAMFCERIPRSRLGKTLVSPA